jgi:hypothetical protein
MPLNNLNFQDCYASEFGSDATGGAHEIPTVDVRRAGEEDGKDGEQVELFEHCCVAYRPADPTEDGACQVLTADAGGTPIAIASRDLRIGKATGALNAGDAAFASPVGKVAFRSNADGTGAVIQQGETADAFISFGKDGTLIFGNQYGQFELGPNGFQVCLANGTAFGLGPDGFSVFAATCALQSGSVALGVGASKPLAATAFTGTVGAGFAPTTPVLNVFVA